MVISSTPMLSCIYLPSECKGGGGIAWLLGGIERVEGWGGWRRRVRLGGEG